MSDIITKKQQDKIDIILRQTDNISIDKIINSLQNNNWDTIKTLKDLYNIKQKNLIENKSNTTEQKMFAAFRNILKIET